MKVFVALIQSAILAVIAWHCFNSTLQKFQALAPIDVNTLAQRYFAEKTVNNNIEEPKYKSLAEATQAAERDVAIGKRVLSAEGVKIGGFRLALMIGSAIVGFFAWFIAFFIVYITTKPLTASLDSVWGNFVRYFIAPIVPVTIVGWFLMFFALDFIVAAL